jgi:hypothetical protein
MQDRVIQPERTNFLHNRLNAPIIYKEVNGAHHLTMPHNPAFEDVKSNVITFAELITSQPKIIKP